MWDGRRRWRRRWRRWWRRKGWSGWCHIGGAAAAGFACAVDALSVALRRHLAPLHASRVGEPHGVTLCIGSASCSLCGCAFRTCCACIQIAVLQPANLVAAEAWARVDACCEQQLRCNDNGAPASPSNHIPVAGSAREACGQGVMRRVCDDGGLLDGRAGSILVLSGLTVIIIGQEEATTTSDTSTATLLYPTTASELCINGYVGCGRKITWGPGQPRAGLRACFFLFVPGERERGILSLRAWDCVASARRGLPLGRKIYLLT